MLRLADMWAILQRDMPRNGWVGLEDIYRMVESAAKPDAEDMAPAAPDSTEPKWRRNVRNVLQHRKERGELAWDGHGNYMLAAAGGATGAPSSGSSPGLSRPAPAPAGFDQVWSDLGRIIGRGLTYPTGAAGQQRYVELTDATTIRVVTGNGSYALPREWLEIAWQGLSGSALLTAERLPEPARARADAVLGLLALLPYVEHVAYPRSGVFRADHSFSDAELSSSFGVGLRRGIRYAGEASSPRHVVFTTRQPTGSRGGHPYRDRWDGGVLWYTGEGMSGNQELTRGNLALSSARDNPVPVFGFTYEHSGTYRYLGRFRVEDVVEEQQPDAQGKPRRVYVFRMRPIAKAAEEGGGLQAGAGRPAPAASPLPPISATNTPPAAAMAQFERAFAVEPTPSGWDWGRAMRRLIEWVEGSGFVFEPWQVAAYVTALRTKPFVILAGTSGTGKSQLPQLVARACGCRFEVIPVRPDWTDSSDLLGFTDLTGAFRPGRLLQFASVAEGEPQKGHVLVLDEMNLARVEHYFAEVLSRIEDRRIEGGSWVCRPLLTAAPRDTGAAPESGARWNEVCLPPNLALVGTVNMDESTHGFSRKVLDRAFTLELSETRLSRWGAASRQPGVGEPWPASVLVPPRLSLAQATDLSPDQIGRVTEVIATLERLNDALRQAQLQVGYRVRDEIALFVINAADAADSFVTADGEPVDPLDLAVSMKVLPRVAGGSGAIRRVLHGLMAWATGRREADEEATEELVRSWSQGGRPSALRDLPYPRCAARLCLMWERMVDDGFTSYWL